MQFTNLKLRLLGVMTIVFLALVIFLILQSIALGIPDTPDVRLVTSTLIRYYELLDTPLEELDTEQFTQVLLDSEKYQLTDERKEYLSRAGKFSETDSAGYLTAMQTKYAQMQWIEKQRSALEQKAQAEGRQVTDSEWAALTNANNNEAIPYIYHRETEYKTQLLFKSVVIEENKATVRYDDEAALQEATLNYVDGRWFIVDIQAIWVHF